jgi:O-methyltransferase
VADTTSWLRRLYRRMPPSVHRAWRALYARWDRLPVGSRRRWIRDTYFEFGQQSRRNLFLSIARFQHINRPSSGYYFEFGSHEANTMRMAWDAFHHLFDYTFVAFDSVQGLPSIEPIDEQEIWEEGKLETSERDFVARCVRHGIPRSRLVTVAGFYDDSLDAATASRFLPTKAAVVYIDCDLYASTVPVLSFIKPFLQRGTVIVFDDWFCFHGDPERGEQRAWREFCAANPELRFTEFVRTQEAQSFIHLGEPDDSA